METDIQPEQIKRHGKPMPEDMIPYLIGYYHANEELQAKRRAKLQENTERIQKEIEDLNQKWNMGSS